MEKLQGIAMASEAFKWNQKPGNYPKLIQNLYYIPLSESRSGLGGLWEDPGPILIVLAAMVTVI